MTCNQLILFLEIRRGGKDPIQGSCGTTSDDLDLLAGLGLIQRARFPKKEGPIVPDPNGNGWILTQRGHEVAEILLQQFRYHAGAPR